MLLVLSQFSSADTALEQRVANGRTELYVQRAATAAFYNPGTLTDLRTKSIETALHALETGAS